MSDPNDFILVRRGYLVGLLEEIAYLHTEGAMMSEHIAMIARTMPPLVVLRDDDPIYQQMGAVARIIDRDQTEMIARWKAKEKRDTNAT